MLSVDDYIAWLKSTYTNAPVACQYLCDNPSNEDPCYYGPRPSMKYKEVGSLVAAWALEKPYDYFFRATREGWELPNNLYIADVSLRSEVALKTIRRNNYILTGIFGFIFLFNLWCLWVTYG